jgi:uncharacterized DUF497 family protein
VEGDAVVVFEWDWANSDHVLGHGVRPEEAEEAYSDPARKPAAAYTSGSGEPRRAYYGATLTDRVLYVVFTVRGGAVRIVTAREARAEERRRYRAKKGRKK